MNALTTTFYELLADNLNVRPRKPAVVDVERSISYEELLDEVNRVASYLNDRGVRPGDRVIVHLRKSIREVIAMFAVSQVGAVIVNVNAQWTVEQLSFVADDCSARLLIVETQTAKRFETQPIPRSVA